MWIWEWRCCGWLWELIPSRRFPERNDHQPVCPTCKGKPKRKWVKIKR